MKPTTKTTLIVIGSLASVFIVPAILIILHNYIYAFVAIFCFISCFILVGYYSYIEILPLIMREHLEEERIFLSFNGDPEKIRFYKGFKKYFSGELTLEQLEQWFEHHPRKR